jgi:methionyl-tRNA formyltransferase
MKWIILTTETIHHAQFVRETAKVFPPAAVLIERNTLKPPFETAHPLEAQRDVYESEAFFGGMTPAIASLAPTHAFDSVNDAAALELIAGLAPDVVVVFGTGKIGRGLIGLPGLKGAILNLHGGDPREYRGLDSHLWAIYHSDFGGLVTTLHHLNADLDDGDIVLQGALAVPKGMRLHQLRKANTEACVGMTLAALDMHRRSGRFISAPQGRKGRYYSFMPSALKEVCRKKFQAHTERLPDGIP